MFNNLDIQSRIFLESMGEKCKKLSHKKLVIYGIGAYTGYFIEKYKEFSILGLLDKEANSVGKMFYGVPVITLQEAVKRADAILIISYTEMYWNVIYERISEQIGNLPVYFPDGELAHKQQNETNDSYWGKNKEQLIARLNNYDVISFDIFDTLLMRKVLLPSDVWKVMQLYNQENKLIKEDFNEVRQQAMTNISTINPFYTLLDLYEEIQRITDCTKSMRDRLLALEIECESQLVIPRNDIKEVFLRAKQMGKEVFLISDMYLPSKCIRELLEKCDIATEDIDIWISCEMGASKSNEGKLWKLFREKIGNLRALHIGDNFVADIQNAEEVGIDTFHVYSAYQMLLKSNMRKLASQVISIEDSIVLGIVLAKFFNSPFALKVTNGKFVLDDFSKIGYVIFGSLVNSFLQWVKYQAKKDNIHTLLFFSRDAYLPYKFWEKLDFPCKPLYFYTSRMFVMILNLFTKDDILRLARLPFTGSWEDFLLYRFGIDCRMDDTNTKKVIDTSLQSDVIITWIEEYEKCILAHAHEQRELYKKYIELLTISQEAIGIVDVGYSGSNQFFLEKIRKEKYKGYYLHALTSDDNIYYMENDMVGLYCDSLQNKSVVTQFTQVVEAVFTAPEGMFLGFDSKGDMIFDKLNKNQKTYSDKSEIHQGIQKFINEVMLINEKWNGNKCFITANLAESLLEWGFSNSENISKTVKDTFYIDNAYIGMTERKIFE